MPTPQQKKPEKKRSSRPSRFGHRLLISLQIILLLSALIFLNYLSSQNPSRIDLTRTADFTLSTSTTNYLHSPEIADRQRAITWTLLHRRSSPFYRRTRALAEEYQRISGNQITLQVIDPLRSPDRTAQFCATYNLTLVRDLLLIDARPSDKTPIITETSTGSPALNRHIAIALTDEMVTYEIGLDGQRRPAIYRGEDVLTASLIQATEGKTKTLLHLADKSQNSTDPAASPAAHLAATLRYQNIGLVEANLAGLDKIPETIEGITIIAPEYDFTEPEISVLDEYWNRPRSATLILLHPTNPVPPRLRTFLRAKGVTPRNDRIIGKDQDRIITSVRGTFSSGIPFLKDLAGRSTTFEDPSSSLDVRESAPDLAIKKIAPVPLIEILSDFWGEKDFAATPESADSAENAAESYDPIRDTPPPLHLAAAVTRGAANDDRFAADTSRLVIIANSEFLNPENQRAENIDFLNSSVNWLLHRESFTGLSPRSIGTYKLPLLEPQVTFINRINLFFVPLAFLLLGATVYSTRRS